MSFTQPVPTTNLFHSEKGSTKIGIFSSVIIIVYHFYLSSTLIVGFRLIRQVSFKFNSALKITTKWLNYINTGKTTAIIEFFYVEDLATD